MQEAEGRRQRGGEGGEGREGKACILPNFNKSEESKDLGKNKSLIAYIGGFLSRI